MFFFTSSRILYKRWGWDELGFDWLRREKGCSHLLLLPRRGMWQWHRSMFIICLGRHTFQDRGIGGVGGLEGKKENIFFWRGKEKQSSKSRKIYFLKGWRKTVKKKEENILRRIMLPEQDEQTNDRTRKDRATQPMDHGRLKWATR